MSDTTTHKYTKRITGLFGIQMPPRKVKKYKGHLPMHLILTGNLPSKKNNWIAANNFRQIKNKAAGMGSAAEAVEYIENALRSFMRPSNDFVEWENAAKIVLTEQAAHYSDKYKKYGIIFPLTSVSISVYCYYSGNYVRDNANRVESIQDVLVDVGIITSDAWQHLNRIQVEAENYHGEITDNIFQISLTINLDKTLPELEKITNDNITNPQDILNTFKVKQEMRTAEIGTYHLMDLEWALECYDEALGNSVLSISVPCFKEWTKEQKRQLIQYGYDITELKEKYKQGLIL